MNRTERAQNQFKFSSVSDSFIRILRKAIALKSRFNLSGTALEGRKHLRSTGENPMHVTERWLMRVELFLAARMIDIRPKAVQWGANLMP